MNRIGVWIVVLGGLGLSPLLSAVDCSSLKGEEQTRCRIDEINQERSQKIQKFLETRPSDNKATGGNQWQQSNQPSGQTNENKPASGEDSNKTKNTDTKKNEGWYFGY